MQTLFSTPTATEVEVKTVREYILTVKHNNTNFVQPEIKSSQDAANACRNLFGDDLYIYESFYILLLSQMNKVTGYVKISHGGMSGTVVDVKLIAKYAIESLSPAIILCHNHPSGNLEPSRADKAITIKIKKALSFLDVAVLDHIILAQENYTSMADECLMG